MAKENEELMFMDFHPDTVILGGGDYPAHPCPLRILREAERVICCDGAAQAYLQHEGKAPWRIVGDGDSLPESLLTCFPDIIRRFAEQDTNDQSKATRYALAHGAHRIAYVGATGRREDHTLGNISLLMDYMRMGAEVRMYTDHGVFIPCHNRFEAESPLETQVSIFNFGAIHFRATGMRYPLSDFTSWWQGTLNANTAPHFMVDAEGDFLIYLTYEQKSVSAPT